ncbi:MAG: phosphate/phosphite/phosphonate ABC transporter substrate-binding protein [Gammaproteobacteria bacterium]|nr:phosphate/phosphite/phosphonate ABC transporter substrate-binding protein [Gammaproteobacteria bacterium]
MKYYSSRNVFLGVLLSIILLPASAAGAGNPLVLGVFPRNSATVTHDQLSGLASYLAAQIQRPVQLVTPKDFETFWAGVQNQSYDIVHMHQYDYVEAHKKYHYDVILKNVEFGESTIAGSIIVRKDSGIETIADLKGKTVVFGGGQRAMQSYIVARYLLEQGGLKPGDYVEKFSKNPPNAILAAYLKQADAAGSGDKVLALETVQSTINTTEMRILVRSEQLTHLPWAVKRSLPPELRTTIQTLLSKLHESAEGREILARAQLTGLRRASDQDYDRHREIIKAVLGLEF